MSDAEVALILAPLKTFTFCPFLERELVLDGDSRGMTYNRIDLVWAPRHPDGWGQLVDWWSRTTGRFQELLPEAPRRARYPAYRLGKPLSFDD